MSNPWDVPPFPSRGDADAITTYAMVGRALTEWEELEYQISHLYARLVGRPGLIKMLRKYGEPRIFTDRMNGLKKVAEIFFRQRPNQGLEAELDTALATISRLADRRNEIAHGVVRPLQWIHPPPPEYDSLRLSDSLLQYGLIPALYTHRKLDDKHRPKYIYTASELIQFALVFHDIGGELVRLKIRIERMFQTE